ncbi:MAG: spore coat associated protein CotJA [Clostridia bacterium]|nr:spore coat associated protein CotJA [Clostridia bacterium]
MLLAYVYAPDQRFRMLYSANDALKHGTLFEELYKPMEVYGRE